MIKIFEGIYRKGKGQMQKTNLDLSVKSNAEQSMNKTAVTGMTIMNLVLTVVYVLDVLKGTRGLVSYLIFVALCLVPSIWSILSSEEGFSRNSLYFGYWIFPDVYICDDNDHD